MNGQPALTSSGALVAFGDDSEITAARDAPANAYYGVDAETDLHYVPPPTVAMADDHYARGVQAVKGYDYLAALQHFGKATFLAPNEPLPFVAKAEAYTHLCDLKSAVTCYRKALALMKDPVAAQDLRARLAQVLDAQGVTAFGEGQTRLALRFAEESLGEHYHAVVELHKSLYLVALEDFATAESILTSSLMHRPEVKADACVVLVELMINLRGDFAGAKALLESVLGDFGRHPRVLNAEQFFDASFLTFKQKAQSSLDLDALTKCVLAFPEDASMYLLRAAGFAQQKMYTAAVQDLFAAITKSGGTCPEAVAMMSEILCNIAFELYSVEDFTSAVNYYTEALKWKADDPQLLLRRGDCHVALGNHEDALKDFRLVLVQNPNDVLAKQRLAHLHGLWGILLFNQSKYELAEEEFSKSIRLFDLEPSVFFYRARCRTMLQQPEFALRDLLSCRDLNPTDPEIMRVVDQFCPKAPARSNNDDSGSTARKQRNKNVVNNVNDDEKSMMLATLEPLIRDEVQTRKEQSIAVLSAPSASTSAAVLSSASAEISTKASSIEDKFNPVALREYVKTIRTIAAQSSVIGITNPLVLKSISGGAGGPIVRPCPRGDAEALLNLAAAARQPKSSLPRPPQPVTKPEAAPSSDTREAPLPNVLTSKTSTVWSSSTKKLISRLDRFEVSQEAPIPKKYAQREGDPIDNSGRLSGASSLESVLGNERAMRECRVPQVAPPRQQRSKLSGERNSAALSSMASPNFLSSQPATFTAKPSLAAALSQQQKSSPVGVQPIPTAPQHKASLAKR